MSSKFKHIRVRLASPQEILSWSHGEVKKHETINYRTLKPEPDGLFCEKIFGPMKDYQCACGKAKRNSDRGQKCEKCGVEITESKVRRERMGHIQLASPVVHAWYLKNSPSRVAVLLDLKAKDLEEVVYLASYIVINPGNTAETKLQKKQILSEQEYTAYSMKYRNGFLALTGAEAIKKLLQEVDLEKERNHLRKRLNTSSKQKRDKIIKRLEVVEALYHSDNKPEWMILDILPVIPPDLRPMVQLDGGRFATTDLNDLYRRILNRNNRLKRQFDQHAPHLITKNEKRMLQEAVDSLIDNAKRGKKAATDKNRSLKSLSDMLKGKQGRFRQNLLGKRVDYSGRSVIVVGPDLKMYECGIPRAMAVTLFKPFIIRQLIELDNMPISSAKAAIDNLTPRVWEILEIVAKEHPVLLNRAPTLHRLGIQAFEPKLIDGKAIRLHPLVTTAFNADFDGDQMAVHLPLSPEAQAEARLLMLASNNILNPKDGKPVVTPSQDMVLGNYYLTMEKQGLPNEGHFYSNYEEAYLAYKNGEIELHTRIFLEARSISEIKFSEEQLEKYILTTLGKMIFNSVLPVELPYLNEPTKQNIIGCIDSNFMPKNSSYKDFQAMLERPITNPFSKKFLSLIIAEIFKKFQISETSKILDNLKDLGFEYSTLSGITISASDVIVLEEKQTLIKTSEAKIDKINSLYDGGLLTTSERKNLITAEWTETRSTIQDKLWKELIKHKDNHIFMMADSGARGSTSNFSQLAGMRGLMNNTSGQVMEIPVKANFLEGLTVSEFFISTHGARKGSTDTALKTAESGYLTRRLVDVSQDVIIDQVDCGTEKSFLMEDIKTPDGVVVNLFDRIVGRFAGKDVVNANGEVIVERNEYITNELASDIISSGIEKVHIRSNLTCDSRYGVCMKCYGRNLATNNIVEVGEAVGTIAAQSIGEPGTQLTMRTFHTGGVASTADITQGLPRIQELFEARNPKGKAIISEINGTVKSIDRQKTGINVVIKNNLSVGAEEYEYTLDQTAELLIEKGQQVLPGERLMKGSIAPRELLRVTDTETTQKYIIEEVQKVYCAQGVEISDKHIEIIVRQMMKKISIVTQGDTMLLPGSELSIHEFKNANKNIFNEVMNNNAKEFAVGKPVLLGITRAALKSESFLSACSFQETTKVLTAAAISGKIDPLHGLKENVIIGGLIPAGTGILEEDTFEYEKDEIDDINEYDVTFAEDLTDQEYIYSSEDNLI